MYLVKHMQQGQTTTQTRRACDYCFFVTVLFLLQILSVDAMPITRVGVEKNRKLKS